MSPYQLHLQRWKNGCGSCDCPGPGKRVRVVFARGNVPCDVLFIGEAPGESENVVGQPFIGPAGKLQDRITAKGLEGFPPVKVCYYNLVGCIPRNEDGGKATEPNIEQVRSCSPKLVEFVKIVNPRLIVCLGSWPAKILTQWSKDKPTFHRVIKTIHLTHPAAILRANVVSQGLMEQRNVIALRRAIGDLVGSVPGEEPVAPRVSHVPDDIPF